MGKVLAGRWRGRVGKLLAAGAAVLLAAAGPLSAEGGAAEAAPTIQSVFAPGVRDLALNARPVKADIEQLKKIGKDFPNAYRVTKMRFIMKEPDKFRMEVWAGPLKFIHLINGGNKATYAFGMWRKSKPFGDDPGKRQTPLDLGIVTPGTLRGYKAEYVGAGTEEGRPVYRFRLRYAHDLERYEVISVDTERKCLVKREMHTRIHGGFKCEFTYSDPVQVGAVWIPRRIEVRNEDRRLAGVTEQSDPVVNAGVSDALFRW
ncbi:MAG: hypothetical protein QHJ73_08355 [Armatimonadota bacterium]|nr:hypothetical protein [Armatimonadota bacterium]